MAISFRVNEKSVTSTAAPDTPLVWILREHLQLTGTRIGCGQGVCGSCTVHLEGRAIRSCVLPLSEAADRSITTIEGLSSNTARALQKAWVEEQVPQCGYCQSGQIMQAETLLASNANPTRDEIVEHMDSVLCRCGTYGRIISAIERASSEVER
jgi:isoquinoline 1-oxidoreductase alpha subunit